MIHEIQILKFLPNHIMTCVVSRPENSNTLPSNYLVNQWRAEEKVVLQISKIRQCSKLRDKKSRESSISKVPSIFKQSWIQSRNYLPGQPKTCRSKLLDENKKRALKEKNAYTLVTLLLLSQVMWNQVHGLTNVGSQLWSTL